MKLQLPRISSKIENQPSLDICIMEAMEDDIAIENSFFSKQQLRFNDLHHLEFRTCRFEKSNLNHVQIPNGYLLDVEIIDCDLSNAVFNMTLFRRVHFKSCKLTGADFSEALLDQVTFEDCQMDYVNFSDTKIKGLNFVNCQLQEGSFNSCDLKKASFEKCNLSRCEFISTSLKDLDLRTNDISSLLLSLENLRGAIVSSEQALQLSLLLGIKIKG